MNRVVIAAIPLLAYAWFATGVKPFTTTAYVLIAIPSVAFVVAYSAFSGFARDGTTRRYRDLSREVTASSLAPWLAIALVALVLEAVGLALGGRSPSVPTLSTAVDHLLSEHVERAALYLLWLIAGLLPITRLHVESEAS